ncbi:OPT family small oligopeptide transporter [Spizellomyces punctatus DAOM BR117]|uniref:OPT family small oligopeptide transporter n=1 Tax=Spizellomyces punctatus (strain DAOM BR117) TaxID=645134 RepID=A0A0L0HK55_SPIPD|nr:OPT family small oligopeptide transporter [Spizellomyces punctatus DAOM BR117]KND01270.1 OPT family small oligopeptide transporter [Spizellomyces punctatus DAOM BR117]|eukprot:XP_016609309.1 OPT family small oligopeptide transporter [Spizellomyces punctatus DAOM BR117]
MADDAGLTHRRSGENVQVTTESKVADEPVTKPRDDPSKHDPTYVPNEKGGIESGNIEFDEEDPDDAIAKAINSVVPQTDNPEDPVTSFRAVLLGTFFGLLLCIANNIMAFRPVAVIIPPTIATLLSYPMGLFLARTLPTTKYKLFGRYDFTFNPGPFNMKEHVIITMIASAAGGGTSGIPYGMDNVVSQKWIARQPVKYIDAFAWVVCTQMMGFGFAGLLRRFIVWPREMIWPGNFAQLALFASYHKKDDELLKNTSAASKYKLSRYTFFWIVAACVFAYQWLPLYMFTALQSVSLLCFFSKNMLVKQLGSANRGLGFLTFTFDWEYITSTWLTTPFWVAATMVLSQVFWNWIVTPAVHFSGILTGSRQNVVPFGALPGEFEAINSSGMFDKDGQLIPKSKLYNPDFTTNQTFVEAHGPFRITPYFYMGYVMSFFNLSAVLVHIWLWYGPQIKRQLRQMIKSEGREGNDLHNRLMRSYPEVPELVYVGIAVLFFVGMLCVGQFTVFDMPWWSVILATFITMIFIVPIGIVQSVTGIQIGLNVVTEFIIGLILPGHTITVMCFKSFGYNIMIQAMQLTSDLKLGHYLHIPPWHMLFTQLYGTLLQGVFATLMSLWIIDNWGPDGSDRLGKGDWAAQSYKLFFNAGAIWGVIGPKDFFSGAYSGIYWAFLAGAICPVLPWLGNKYYPSRWWIFMNFPIFSASYGSWGAGLPSNFVWTTFIVSFTFQFYLYRRKYDWWAKYNYVFGAAADVGMTVALIIIAFFSASVAFPIWKGNPDLNAGYDNDWYCTDTTEYGQTPQEIINP